MAFGGRSRWKAGRALPIRTGPGGVPAANPTELAMTKMHHFAKAEAALIVPFQRLTEEHEAAPTRLNQCGVRLACNVPTLREVIMSLAHAPCHRAVGMDGVPQDLLKAAPAELATVLHPLYAKIALVGQEPLAFKGAVAIDLYKGK